MDDGWMDGWGIMHCVDGWMGNNALCGWMDGWGIMHWMGGWMDGCMGNNALSGWMDDRPTIKKWMDKEECFRWVN